jgi:acetyl-CoA synthetase
MGRIDDVVNVSGHRLGTMEWRARSVSHPACRGRRRSVGPTTQGRGDRRLRPLDGRHVERRRWRKELREHVAKEIGAFADPTTSAHATRCPRTAAARSCAGCLRDIACGQGDRRRHDDAWKTSRYAKLREDEE